MNEAAQPGAAVSGAAFPLAVKLLATALVAAMFIWGARAGDKLATAEWTGSALFLLAGAAVLVLWCLTWIWRSRVSVDDEGVHQTWLWDKHVRWADIAQARLVGVPMLEWIVAPRLVARVRGKVGVMVFHAADPQVVRALARFVTTGSHA